MQSNISLELRKYVTIIFLIVFLTPYLFSSMSMRTIQLPKIKPLKTQVNTVKSVNKTAVKRKTILFWNQYWDFKYFKMGAGNRGFKPCPNFHNCYTTTRRSKLINKHEIIDAVVFHGVSLKIYAIEKLKEKRRYLSKLNKGIEPLFILFMLVSCGI